MLHTIIKENSYQDSVNLMLLTNKLSSMEGVNKLSIMMGTPANMDIFRNTGLYTDELKKAKPNDMCIVVDTNQPEKLDEVLAEIDSFLKNQAVSGNKQGFETVRTWDKAISQLPNANLAIISVPGQYAAEEAEKALDNGLHAFIFSDNVSGEDELRLKQKAHEKGLLVMGPDCGTGIISGVPIAFANVVKEGNIGIVGASGTGIQEVTTIIDRLGAGVSYAIGTGGRDLSRKIGAITVMDSLIALENNPPTEVIVLISKPPAAEVRDRVVQLLHSFSKPVVAIFMGEKPEYQEEGIYYAHTLEETAKAAVAFSKGQDPAEVSFTKNNQVFKVEFNPNQQAIKGLYSGGTLATEAAMLIIEALGLKEDLNHEEGYILKLNGHEVVDLGDDIYTQGKPHPMIDPTTRVQFIQKAAEDESTAVILFDVVLGYGSHDDMAGALVPALEKAKKIAEGQGRKIAFVATVCGTDKDPQNYVEQVTRLKNAGVIVRESNVQAVATALGLLNHSLKEEKAEKKSVSGQKSKRDFSVSAAITKFLTQKPIVINVGLKKFTNAVQTHGGSVVQFDWRPVAGGNERMRKILSFLNEVKL